MSVVTPLQHGGIHIAKAIRIVLDADVPEFEYITATHTHTLTGPSEIAARYARFDPRSASASPAFLPHAPNFNFALQANLAEKSVYEDNLATWLFPASCKSGCARGEQSEIGS